MRSGWIPIRVFWKNGRPMVDWCLLGEQRFTDPFFENTIQAHLEHPFHHAFRRQTSIDELRDWSQESPGLAPSGFIFHESRCGSTLICRMLAASPRNVVLSEPSPADAVLRSHFRQPGITREQRVEWFRWMVSALGQKRAGGEQRLFIKFDAWNLAELPVIRQAFPDTPWIFLYREPVEVLVSQVRQPAPWTFPGILHPAVVGMEMSASIALPHEEYCARILARVCRFGLAHHRTYGGKLVNYRELPEFVCSGLLPHFDVEYPAADLELMRSAALENAKRPNSPFEADSAAKRESASQSLRELAQQWIEPVYRELEAARVAAPMAAALGRS